MHFFIVETIDDVYWIWSDVLKTSVLFVTKKYKLKRTKKKKRARTIDNLQKEFGKQSTTLILKIHHKLDHFRFRMIKCLLNVMETLNKGCKGGHLDRAWNYMRRYGVVNDECYPYVSGQTGKVNKCKVGRRSNLLTLGCQLTKSGYGSGRDESATSSQKSLFKTLPAYRISPRQFDIMNEIRQRGPVQGKINTALTNDKYNRDRQ